MPDYDYQCQECDHEFTVHLSMSEHDELDKKHEIHCPKCDSDHVRHVIASVNVMTSRKS